MGGQDRGSGSPEKTRSGGRAALTGTVRAEVRARRCGQCPFRVWPEPEVMHLFGRGGTEKQPKSTIPATCPECAVTGQDPRTWPRARCGCVTVISARFLVCRPARSVKFSFIVQTAFQCVNQNSHSAMQILLCGTVPPFPPIPSIVVQSLLLLLHRRLGLGGNLGLILHRVVSD